MAYTTLERLLERMPQSVLVDLTDESEAGVIDEAMIDRAIGDADTEIDSSIGKRYATPVDPVPALLARLSLDLAIEILYSRRSHVATPEAVVRAAKNARTLLANIAANKADIPGIQEADRSGTSAAGASFNASDRLFSRASVRGA